MILAAILMGRKTDSIMIQLSSTINYCVCQHLQIKLPPSNMGTFHSTRNYKIFKTETNGTEI